MRRKSIMLFLCVALTGSLLTGCGDTKKEQKTEQNKKTEAVDNKSEQTAEEEQTQTPDDMTEIQETAMAIPVMVVMDMTMAMVETAVTAI